eukprot:CAMPEP_0119375308 /NCGR_PEP_ID=MMETSP1334-20130426/35017_1 /TAXON_ID=127549 /ORGANISM="Calcidiscus leptoporus, Strain RCC1130" /LENGTH=63 /DNA_ID=CAMNT_0007393575 /DNA_START=253 /DNA_END=440 /DNA_ORIENTATION=+
MRHVYIDILSGPVPPWYRIPTDSNGDDMCTRMRCARFRVLGWALRQIEHAAAGDVCKWRRGGR